jgi:hypothetical protein
LYQQENFKQAKVQIKRILYGELEILDEDLIFSPFYSLIKMYDASYTVIYKIIDDETIYSQRGDASATSKILSSFKFVFILYLMFEIMVITNIL